MTTETQITEKDAQYDAMIQQFMGDATSVDGDPGAVHPFTQGTGALADTEAVMRVADTAGDAWVWHTQTYKAVPVNLNMLPAQLRKKDEFGKPLFTVYGPEDDRSPIKGMYPTKGIHKCLLHPNGEHRAYYNTLGLPTCLKSTIASPFQVTRHMQVKHEQEWAALEQMREKTEKDDDRAFQRGLFNRAAEGNAPVAPASEAPIPVLSGVYIGDGHNSFTATDEPLVTEAKRHGPKPKKKRKQQMLACTMCNLKLEAGSTLAVRARLKKHMKEEHADG